MYVRVSTYVYMYACICMSVWLRQGLHVAYQFSILSVSHVLTPGVSFCGHRAAGHPHYDGNERDQLQTSGHTLGGENRGQNLRVAAFNKVDVKGELEFKGGENRVRNIADHAGNWFCCFDGFRQAVQTH